MELFTVKNHSRTAFWQFFTPAARPDLTFLAWFWTK